MRDIDTYKSPWAWYGLAGFSAIVGCFFSWLAWFSAQLHPAEFPVAVDFVVMALAVAAFFSAIGFVRVAVAFRRGEGWTGRALFGVQLAMGAMGVLALANLVWSVWQRIAAL
jgi:hypothetical protein